MCCLATKNSNAHNTRAIICDCHWSQFQNLKVLQPMPMSHNHSQSCQSVMAMNEPFIKMATNASVVFKFYWLPFIILISNLKWCHYTIWFINKLDLTCKVNRCSTHKLKQSPKNQWSLITWLLTQSITHTTIYLQLICMYWPINEFKLLALFKLFIYVSQSDRVVSWCKWKLVAFYCFSVF